MLWSVGINGDKTMDAIVAPIFLQFLAANTAAATQHQPLPNITALGFFTTFVNVGGTGATLALALVMWNSREPGYRKVSRLSLPTQIFQINEPIFFGFPIVVNPVFAIRTSSMRWSTAGTPADVLERHSKPLVNALRTTPPIVGHSW
jgi:PTS system cellobiose-specific IIC component